MKNTQQDRFEKKLIRFINDVDKGWQRDRAPDANLSDYFNYRDEKMKEYGFTEEECAKAYRLIRSWSKLYKRYDRKKFLKDKIKDLEKSDNADNVNGEMELKAIDDWIADVYDN